MKKRQLDVDFMYPSELEMYKKHFKHAHEGVLHQIACNSCHNGKTEVFTVEKHK